MSLFTEKRVRAGSVSKNERAASPTVICPWSPKCIIDGTKEYPLTSFNTTGCLVSGCTNATRLLVVPKSIPTIISGFCKLPVVMLIPILGILLKLAAKLTLNQSTGSNYYRCRIIFPCASTNNDPFLT